MVLYKDTRSLVRSPDGDTKFFRIVAIVAPLLFILALDYVLRMSLDNNTDIGYTLKPSARRRNQAKQVTDADYANDLAILSNIFPHAERLLHALEKLTDTIGLYVNAKKTEAMNFKSSKQHHD